MTATYLIALAWLALMSTQAHGAAINEEIYNGKNAKKGQFPYQVLLIQTDSSGQSTSCGGSVISDQWILTAAHCSDGATSTRVYTGLSDMNDFTGVQVYTVPKSDHYIYPSYNPQTITHDIALLRLPSRISMNQYVQKVALPTRSQQCPKGFDNQMATASGWGRTSDTSSGFPEYLQYTTINIYPHTECQDYYRNVNYIDGGMICTDKKVVYAGPCKGDSGGPLVVNGTDGKPVVIGAVSWGVGACSSGNPVVYAFVPNYLTWIRQTTGISIS